MTYNEVMPSLNHQKKAREKSAGKRSFGFTMEQGTGKSKTLIDDTLQNYLAGKIEGMIITSPNGVQREWKSKHLALHVPKDIEYVAVVLTPKPSKKKQQELEWAMQFKGFKVFVLNYEAIQSKASPLYKVVKQLLLRFKLTWSLDESHRIGNWESKTTQTIMSLRSLATSRRIMTGTLAARGPLAVFPQMYFLDPKILGFDSFVSFKCHFAEIEPDNARTMWIIKDKLRKKYGEERAKKMMPKIVAKDGEGRPMYKNLGELKELIDPYTFRVLKKDCLDLPAKVYGKRHVTLNTKQRQVYDSLRDEYMAEMEGNTITTTMALTRLTRLQQITGGFFPTDDGRLLPIGTTNPKLEEVLEMVEEVEGKIIIWARFKSELSLMHENLKKIYGPLSTARYWGDVPKVNKDNGKAAFCDPNHECRFFVAQQQSGGTGLDGLQIAQDEIFFSNDFSLINRLQAEDRGHRIGMGDHLTITDLQADDTRDGFIIDSLISKKDVSDAINGDPKLAWI